jgi:hypothetical protein
VELQPSTVDFLGVTKWEAALLNSEEKEYLVSTKTFTVNDKKAIKAFARNLDSATYKGPVEGYSGRPSRAKFTCHYKDGHATFFTVIGRNLETEDRQWFTLDAIDLTILSPTRLWALQTRLLCKFYLDDVHQKLGQYAGRAGSFPSAGEWCDTIVNTYRAHGYTVSIDEFLQHIRCPAIKQGKCNYALNPECRLDSPSETVLLFETKPGWNQHGGPELFTFDNHDPKGGCVLLNDGTVKFIRTKEELAQLCWKP